MNAENREEVYFTLQALVKPIYTSTIITMDGVDYKILGFGDWYYDLNQKEQAEADYSALLDAKKKIRYEAGTKQDDMVAEALNNCVIWRYRDVYLQPMIKKATVEIPELNIDNNSGKILSLKN